MKKLTPLMSCALILLLLPLTQPRTTVKAATNTIWVPQDQKTIQEAINHAADGDIIRVSPRIYHEKVTVNKTVSLIGDSPTTTIIEGARTQAVIYVKANNVVVSGFTVQNGYSGIEVDHSSNPTIRGNKVNNNEGLGIKLNYANNCTLRNNTLINNKYNFEVEGETLRDFINDIDTSNTVNGKPIYYLINQNNLVVNPSAFPEIGYLAFVNSTNINVKDLTLTQNSQGILFAYMTNSIISNVTTTSNWNGIEVKAASNVAVTGNNANNNFDFGIKFEHSRDSTVSRNNVNNNGWAGIGIFTSQSIVVNANMVNNNTDYGIDLVYSSNNVVSRNSVANNKGAYSMVIYYSSSNFIYHNNFVNHFIFKLVPTTNTWDNGFEGNYWSNYNGSDTNQDGIGDTAYRLEEGNQDRYPLMGRFSFFNVTPEHYITTISNSTISNFEFDQANKKISFNAAGRSESLGFCRIRVPTELIKDSYTVSVKGHEPLTLKELPTSNETYKYLYLTYNHTISETETVLPEPPIVPISIALSIVTVFTLIVVILRRRKKAPTEDTLGETEDNKTTKTTIANTCLLHPS